MGGEGGTGAEEGRDGREISGGMYGEKRGKGGSISGGKKECREERVRREEG